MFGDAVDLAVPGTTNAQRKATVMKWNSMARVGARAFYVERFPGDPCNVAVGGRKWRCAHADWRTQRDRYKNDTPSPGQPAKAADVPVESAKKIENLSRSQNWRDRRKAFERLNLNPGQPESTRADDRPAAPYSSVLDNVGVRALITRLLAAELAHRESPYDEDHTEYFIALVEAAGLYACPDAADLLLQEQIMGSGRFGWTAAARMGDAGVPQLLRALRMADIYYYRDLIGVACEMLKYDHVTSATIRNRLEAAVIQASRRRDGLTKYLVAECTRWLPHESALALLKRLAAPGQEDDVREMANESLKALLRPESPPK